MIEKINELTFGGRKICFIKSRLVIKRNIEKNVIAECTFPFTFFFFNALILDDVIVVTEYSLIISFKTMGLPLLFTICLFFFLNLKRLIVLSVFCDSSSVKYILDA